MTVLRLHEKLEAVIAPGKPGEIREVYAVEFSSDERGPSDIRFVTDNKAKAKELAQEKMGWYGGTGWVAHKRVSVICLENGEWSIFHRMPFHDSVAPEGYAAERALKSAQEKARKLLSPEELKTLGLA